MDINSYIKNGKLSIIVKANANKTEITGFDENKSALKLDIKAPADKNKANSEIVRLLSKISGRRARIKSGLLSKEKIIEFS